MPNTFLCYFIECSYNYHYDNTTLIFQINKSEYLVHDSCSGVLTPLLLFWSLTTQYCLPILHLQLWFSV